MCLADAALTLGGQSADYWNDSYRTVNELSPDVHTLLSIHPMVFVMGVLTWLTIIALLSILLPQMLAIGFSTTVTVAHSIGCATWTIWRPPFGYQITMAGSVVVGVLITVSILLTLEKENRPAFGIRSLSKAHWVLIALLISIPIYAFLIPH